MHLFGWLFKRDCSFLIERRGNVKIVENLCKQFVNINMILSLHLHCICMYYKVTLNNVGLELDKYGHFTHRALRECVKGDYCRCAYADYVALHPHVDMVHS